MKLRNVLNLFLGALALLTPFIPNAVYAAPGDLYVAVATTSSSGNGAIFKFTPDGKKSTFASGLSLPFGLAFDGIGNLWAVEGFGGMILKFTPDGSESIFATGLSSPHGLAFDGKAISS